MLAAGERRFDIAGRAEHVAGLAGAVASSVL